jgi:hypothetical protein
MLAHYLICDAEIILALPTEERNCRQPLSSAIAEYLRPFDHFPAANCAIAMLIAVMPPLATLRNIRLGMS